MESVISNLQTGSDFRQLASTSPDCKLVENQGKKRVVYSRLKYTVYDAQLSFVIIYKVGKCMMPGVLKICSDFKSRVVYSRLKTVSLFRLGLHDILHAIVMRISSVKPVL